MAKRLVVVISGLLLATSAAAVATGPTVAVAAPAADSAAALPGGSYVPLALYRTYDTRLYGRIPVNKDVGIKVGGVSATGVPGSGVSAVAINLIVINPSTAGWISVFDPANGRGGTSTITFAAHQTVDEMAIVPVDSLGFVGVRTTTVTDVGIDVEGYFTSADTASSASGLFNPIRPARLMDTRSNLGGAALAPGATRTLQVTGRGGVPATGVTAVVVNVIAVQPTATGYITAFPNGASPSSSTVNFGRGEIRANRAIVRVGTGGKISVRNGPGTTPLIIDVSGYFTAATSTAGGSYFVPFGPRRLVSSATAPSPKWTVPGKTNAIPITIDDGATDLAPSINSVTPTTAVVLTLASVNPSTTGVLTAYPAGTTRPGNSDLNVKPATTTSNSAITAVGAHGEVNVFASTAGTVVIDVSGYFARAPKSPSPTGLWASWDQPRYNAVRTNSLHDLSSIVVFRLGPSFALRPDGTVVGWMASEPGAPNLPLDSSASVHTVPGLSNVMALAASGNVTGTGYALRGDGTVWSWGDNGHGELGNGSPYATGGLAPVSISGVVRVGAGDQIGYAVKGDGTLWAWGRNDQGQLGDGTTTDRHEPVQVAGLTDIVSIAGGSYLSYAVDSAGRLWRWGKPFGAAAPIAPERVTNACSVSWSVLGVGDVDYERCLDGTVWQLDISGTAGSTKQLTGLSGVSDIAPGPGLFTRGLLALKNDGTVWRDPDGTGQFSPVYGLNWHYRDRRWESA